MLPIHRLTQSILLNIRFSLRLATPHWPLAISDPSLLNQLALHSAAESKTRPTCTALTTSMGYLLKVHATSFVAGVGKHPAELSATMALMIIKKALSILTIGLSTCSMSPCTQAEDGDSEKKRLEGRRGGDKNSWRTVLAPGHACLQSR
ncbi:uncharacterized [Tachysurus ichikawai]